MKTISYTKEGYEDLLKQKSDLEFQRKDAVKEVTRASELGDRSENAAYKYGKQRLRGIDSQLRFINNQLRYAKVIEPRTDGVIGIASKVIVDDGSGKKEFTIVGGYESNLSKGWISQYSPLGKSLIGKKTGETAVFNAPNGLMKFVIKEVIGI
jgi:transcription elongation GreA/GreB family factor